MCNAGDRTPTIFRAEVTLARLIERELGYSAGHIDSVALRLFIKANWDQVALLAHKIHES